MTTIDNITDEQIEALAVEADAADDLKQLHLCAIALGHRPGDRQAARAACAKAIASAEAQS